MLTSSGVRFCGVVFLWLLAMGHGDHLACIAETVTDRRIGCGARDPNGP